MKEYYEKVCQICGAEFIAQHGNKRMCPTCYEQFEARVRQKNIADYKDTIVAIGYADRQREKTLAMVGKIKVTL